MPGTLVIEPLYGLGNRLEAVLSACALAERAGARVLLVWRAHPTECGCLWRDLFEPSETLDVGEDSTSAPISSLKAVAPNFDVARVERRLRNGETVELRAFQRFRLGEESEASFLQRTRAWTRRLVPVRAVRERIPRIEPGTLGLHVRGTDHWVSLRHAPPRAFLQRTIQELQRDPRLALFLAADSRDVRERFGRVLGSRLVVAPEPELRRTRPESAQGALADMLGLARCARVLCPPQSTFAPCATHFGAPVPEVVCLGRRPWKPPGSWMDRYPQLLLVFDQENRCWCRKPLYGRHRWMQPFGWLALQWARRLAADEHRWGRDGADFHGGGAPDGATSR